MTLLIDLAGFAAAVLAGTSGCLIGIRAADWVNQRLGRNVPTQDETEQGDAA